MRLRQFALVLVLLGLTACGQQGANLLEGASPETSALALYTWDGEVGTCRFLFDTQQEEMLLKALNALPAEKLDAFSIQDLSAPVYVLEISDREGHDLTAAWCSGVWVTREGTAYVVDVDFAQILEAYDWDEPDGRSLSGIPGIQPFATDGEHWNPLFLEPAEALDSPAGIRMTVDAVDGDEVTACFHNDSEQEWSYGYYYGLQVELDGQWYQVPAAESFGVIDMAVVLPAGGSQQESYDLRFYGDLPDGAYRLVAEGCSAALTRAGGAWQAA